MYTDNHISLVEHTQFNGLSNAPFEAAVNVFLPVGFFEVGFFFGEVEGVDTAVEVGILVEGGDGFSKVNDMGAQTGKRDEVTYSGGGRISSNHNDGADGPELGDDTGRFAAESLVSKFRS